MVIILSEPLRGNPIPRALMNNIDEYIPDDFFVDLLNVFKVASLISLFFRNLCLHKIELT